MTFASLLPQTLTLVATTTDGTVDAYGNPVLESADPVTVKGRLDQVTSSENDLTQRTVVDRWRVLLPADTTISAGDVILEGGRSFQVDGTPEVVYGASAPHHIEAHLIYSADVTPGVS